MDTKSSDVQSTELIIPKDEFKLKIEERLNEADTIMRYCRTYFENELEDVLQWDDYNSELLKQSFNNPHNEYVKSYDDSGNLGKFPLFEGPRSKSYVKFLDFEDEMLKKINNLKNLLSKVDLLKFSIECNKILLTNTSSMNLNDIFIVHGHSEEIKINVARTIEKLGLNPIILHEKANEGRTIIEKFEIHSNVGFAIILLTCDDIGKLKFSNEEKYRARQNVILEMGFFIGKIGRNRVFPLYENSVELPSDLNGLLYTPLDENGKWKFSLIKELQAVGYQVDANKIL